MNDPLMSLQIASATDIGRRSHNEDACFVDQELGLALVADGVGGHQAGEIASAITCATLAQEVAAGRGLDRAIRAANQAIMAAVGQGQGRDGMATTAVALCLDGADYELAWVGDSRAYLWDGTLLKLLTRDHSLVETLLSRGDITLEEARKHPQRNVVVQAIGLQADSSLRVDINRGTLKPGQLILLCSDGVSDVLDNGALVDVLRSGESLQARCDALVRSAVKAGGTDNATAVLLAAPDDLKLGSVAEPDIVWTFDPRSGKVSGLNQIAPAAPKPQLTRVAPKRPETTQLMSVAEVEKELARVQGRPPPAEESGKGVWAWVVLCLALAACATALVALGFIPIG